MVHRLRALFFLIRHISGLCSITYKQCEPEQITLIKMIFVNKLRKILKLATEISLVRMKCKSINMVPSTKYMLNGKCILCKGTSPKVLCIILLVH